MLNLFRFTTFFTMIIVFNIYSFANIKDIKGGSLALPLLALFVLLGAFLFFLQVILKRRLYIKKSFLFLILFFAHLTLNILLNKPSALKALLLATTGGIILFYSLGCLISINLAYIKEKTINSKQFLKIFNFFYFVYIIVFTYLFLDTSIASLANIRDDLFLIQDNLGLYQRPGSFLVILFFIYTFLTVFLFVLNKNTNKNNIMSFILFILFVFYLLLAILGMALSQLLGSNNAFVCIGGLFIATIVFYVFSHLKNSYYLLSKAKVTLKKLFLSQLAKKIFAAIFLSIFIGLFLSIVTINTLGINLNTLRIFGFGANKVSALDTRVGLWNNFIVHFSYNPIFGNITVDTLTTGEGSFVHSLIASLLTHCGIIGFILFFAYIFTAIKEIFNYSDNLIINNSILIYSLMIFFGIFVIATVATFFTWIPLWFLFGLIFPPFRFTKRTLI